MTTYLSTMTWASLGSNCEFSCIPQEYTGGADSAYPHGTYIREGRTDGFADTTRDVV